MQDAAQVPQEPAYFQGFNGLRFYAALSVLIYHVSYSPNDWYGFPTLPPYLEYFFLTGVDAVRLFFILSGFLIITLMLRENTRQGYVNMRKFYMRRALRIYPVYFILLIVVVALFGAFYKPLLLFMLTFFLGNVAYVLFYPFPPLEHLWSIAVEEQFYLVAPLLSRRLRILPQLLIGFMAMYWGLLILSEQLPPNLWTALIQITRYDLIAMGALLGYAHYHHWSVLRYLRSRLARFVAVMLVLYAVIFAEYSTAFVYTTIMALAFSVIIYWVAVEPPRLLRSGLLEWLGNYSYSMYVYHPLVIFLLYQVLHNHLPLPAYAAALYGGTLGITLILSGLSQHYVERPLARLRRRLH